MLKQALSPGRPQGGQKLSPFLNPSFDGSTPCLLPCGSSLCEVVEIPFLVALPISHDQLALNMADWKSHQKRYITLLSRKLRNNMGSISFQLDALCALSEGRSVRQRVPAQTQFHTLSPSILAGSKTVFSARTTSVIHQRDMLFSQTMDVFSAAFTFARPHVSFSFIQLARQH